MQDCIFCKIARGEIPCAKIWEDKEHLAFLDLYPPMKGMTLIIPKKHFGSYAADMDDKNYCNLFLAAKKVSKLLDKKLGAIRTAMVMEGMEINHVHIKLYPLYHDIYQGYLSTKSGAKADINELNKLAEKIRGKL